MKIDKKTTAIVALLAVIAIGSPILSYTFGQVTPSVGMSHVSALYETSVTHQVEHNGAWGPVINDGHNLVVNVGLNWTLNKLFYANSTGQATVIALGNGTNVEVAGLQWINSTTENQAISSCGLAPVTISGSNLSTGVSSSVINQSLSYVWASSCNSIIVNGTALYNQTTNNSQLMMFAGKNFANSVTLQSGDQLNVTWYVWATST